MDEPLSGHAPPHPGPGPTAGMIGGLGPESTIDYYRMILARFREQSPAAPNPHLIINSLDVDKGIALLAAGRLDDLADYLASAVEALARAGAGFAFIAANTPHLVFGEVQRRSPIPLLSIVRACSQRAQSLGLKRLGLFGTGFTMGADFYPLEFARLGMELVRPSQIERRFIHDKYIGELLKNHFLPETRDALLHIAERMRSEDGIEALVLAGTELSLLLREAPPPGLPLLDTTSIHVEAIVDALLASDLRWPMHEHLVGEPDRGSLFATEDHSTPPSSATAPPPEP